MEAREWFGFGHRGVDLLLLLISSISDFDFVLFCGKYFEHKY